MIPEEIAGRLRERFTDVLVARGEVTVLVSPADVPDALASLRDDPVLSFDSLRCLTATHHPGAVPPIWVAYEMRSSVNHHRVRVKAGLDGDDAPHVPSVTGAFPTANWQEREVFDFFGVIFQGHPDMRRILMPEDYEGFPQRRDFPMGGEPVLFTFNEHKLPRWYE